MKVVIFVTSMLTVSTPFNCLARRLKKTPKKTPRPPPRPPKKEQVCKNGSRLYLSVRCQDSSELLYVVPMEVSQYLRGTINEPDVCAPGGAVAGWAAATTCPVNGGFQEVLPYYTGCYQENTDIWNMLIANKNATGTSILGYPLPSMNLPNLDFEDAAIGLSGWGTVVYGPANSVSQQTDLLSRCSRLNTCLAYNGTGYARISAGDTMDGVTPPNSMNRSDFLIPIIDRNNCKTSVKFCFSFAMRFISKEIFPISETGKNDYFKVEIQVGDNGPMLFEKNVSSASVEGMGNSLGLPDFGHDGGWERIEIELPDVELTKPTFFTFRAMTMNVGDFALDSIGYVDSLNIAPCTDKIVVL